MKAAANKLVIMISVEAVSSQREVGNAMMHSISAQR